MQSIWPCCTRCLKEGGGYWCPHSTGYSLEKLETSQSVVLHSRQGVKGRTHCYHSTEWTHQHRLLAHACHALLRSGAATPCRRHWQTLPCQDGMHVKPCCSHSAWCSPQCRLQPFGHPVEACTLSLATPTVQDAAAPAGPHGEDEHDRAAQAAPPPQRGGLLGFTILSMTAVCNTFSER